MGIVGSVVAFVTAQKLAQEEKKRKKRVEVFLVDLLRKGIIKALEYQ